jgi:hypothetical protein
MGESGSEFSFQSQVTKLACCCFYMYIYWMSRIELVVDWMASQGYKIVPHGSIWRSNSATLNLC